MTFLFGGIIAIDDIKKEQITTDNKSKAKMSGNRFYNDGNNKQRSCETNEVCVLVNNGGLKMVGVSSGKVYEDITLEKMKKENAKLSAAGKKFHYELFPQWKGKNGEPLKLPVENSTGRPFDLGWVRGRDIISYYNTNSRITPEFDIGAGRCLSSEEVELYRP